MNLDTLTKEQIELAISDPKAFLRLAQFAPLRAESRLSRLEFFDQYVDTVPGIKEHCKMIAQEAAELIQFYKSAGNLLQEFLGDHRDYELVRRQFYLGETLREILDDMAWTRRWAQTLQNRALKVFTQRLAEEYDKRRTCSED